MEFDVVLTSAECFQDAFETENDSIRLDNISSDELEVLNQIVSRNDGIVLIALPHPA